MALIYLDPKVAVPCILPMYEDEENPPVHHLKYVPYSKVKMYEARIRKRVNVNKRKFNEVAKEVQKEQFLENLTKVEGPVFGGRPITSISEYYDLIDADEMEEIIKTMESRAKLSAAQIKNFKGASGTDSNSDQKEVPISTVATVPSEIVKSGTAEIEGSSQQQA